MKNMNKNKKYLYFVNFYCNSTIKNNKKQNKSEPAKTKVLSQRRLKSVLKEFS